MNQQGKRSSRYRAIESFTRDVEGRDGSAMVDLVAHRLEDSVGQRMLQLEQEGHGRGYVPRT